MTAGVVVVLAGLAVGDGGPGLGAARQAAEVNFAAGEWKGVGWSDDGGPWSLSLRNGTLTGYRVTGRDTSDIFFLSELNATGGELRFSPHSCPPASARITYRVEGRRLMIRGGGCLFVLRPVPPKPRAARRALEVRLYLCHVDASWAARRLTVALGGGAGAGFWGDKRTNALFFRATPEKARRAWEIIRRLDVPIGFYIIPLRNADAAVAAQALAVAGPLLTLVSDGREVFVTADVRTNAVIISASEGTAEQLKRALRWLDGAAK